MTVHDSLRTFLAVSICLLAAISVAQAQYAGGTGEADDPYRIATAADLITLGETPDDYDKHFILTADIDLAPNLPGGRVFDRAVIASDANDAEDGFQGTYFTGVFDGNDHTVSNLVIMGEKRLGLFGMLGDGAIVLNLGLEAVDVSGNEWVGGLVGYNGYNGGHITTCYSTGMVRGTGSCIGGLVGFNRGRITACYNTGTVSGRGAVGGLVGANFAKVRMSYSAGTVTGDYSVGGLVGDNLESDFGLAYGNITTSYSSCTVSGTEDNIGGFVGSNSGYITASHSIGTVSGPDQGVGGLVGRRAQSRSAPFMPGSTTASFWNIQTSGQTASSGGAGLTTAEMQDINTYINAGWDLVGEIHNGTCDYWRISPDGYPELRFPVMPEGSGTAEQPYLIRDAFDLGTVWFQPMAYYRLEASIDLSGVTWSMPVVPHFDGTFDGNGYVISNLHIQANKLVGLFGGLGPRGRISDLRLEAVDVNGTDEYVGGLAGSNYGCIADSYSTGAVTGGRRYVGGLVGINRGNITASYSDGMVTGGEVVGGNEVGGLVGMNWGSIVTSYSDGMVTGGEGVGGLVGTNSGSITTSYSTATVSGIGSVGGLVGVNWGSIAASFWDVETSGLKTIETSWRGTGLTTTEMQTASTFLEAGWDFIDETENGTEDMWKIAEGLDYPRLWWEEYDGQVTLEVGQRFTVTLESNPSTGYRWEWVDRQESILEQIGEAEFKPRETGDPPLVGAGGWEIFTFEAVSPGQMTLELVYRRPWDEGVEPLKTFSLQVVVP